MLAGKESGHYAMYVGLPNVIASFRWVIPCRLDGASRKSFPPHFEATLFSQAPPPQHVSGRIWLAQYIDPEIYDSIIGVWKSGDDLVLVPGVRSLREPFRLGRRRHRRQVRGGHHQWNGQDNGSAHWRWLWHCRREVPAAARNHRCRGRDSPRALYHEVRIC